MKTLFDHAREERLRKESPLAARMRPRTLDEYIGQRHILAPGRLLRRAIQADQLSSLIFYGPPGTGKTTLASVIANTTSSAFVTLNAVMAGIADLRSITAEAQRRLGEYGQRTILFIDEVHRWNKAQQDALLPWVENGTVILVGATTENPYFTVNRALVSRSRIFQLKPLAAGDVKAIIHQALSDSARGYGLRKIVLEDDALSHLADVANGDARAALNALELAVETTAPSADDGVIRITLPVAEESIQHRAVLYDREGDCHFDTISAFIKSMRGSDPDATFYWLAKMIYAGEDPRFIFRRMLIFASEDIGMADPHALQVVTAAAESFDRVGLPEGHYPLAHAALYCATAPKSNSVMGFFDALKCIEKEREGEVPNHLRDPSRDQDGFGHGVGYKYPHEYRQHWVAQQYLPASLQGRVFYEPGEIGYESTLADQIRERRELQLAALRESEDAVQPPEILTFSYEDKQTSQWLARAVDSLAGGLAAVRTGLFRARAIQRHELVLDLCGSSGLLTWEAVRQVPEGGVYSLVNSPQDGEKLLEQAHNLPQLRRPQVVVATVDTLDQAIDPSLHFEFAVGRNVLGTSDRHAARIKAIVGRLAPGGTIALAENIPSCGQRLSRLLDAHAVPPQIAEAEEAIYHDCSDCLVNWNADDLKEQFVAAGLRETAMQILPMKRDIILNGALIDRWFNLQDPGSYAGRLLQSGLPRDAILALRQALAPLVGGNVTMNSTTAIIHGVMTKG